MSYNISGMYKKAMAGVLGAAMLVAPVKGVNLEAMTGSISPQTQQQVINRSNDDRSIDSYFTMNDAYAQGDAKAATSPQQDYKSVEDILKGSQFIIVKPSEVDGLIQHGKTVLFAYDTITKDNWRGRNMAVMLEQASKGIDGINYIAVPYDNWSQQTQTTLKDKYNISGLPAYGFFKDGESLLSISQSPKDNEIAHSARVNRKNIEELKGL